MQERTRWICLTAAGLCIAACNTETDQANNLAENGSVTRVTNVQQLDEPLLQNCDKEETATLNEGQVTVPMGDFELVANVTSGKSATLRWRVCQPSSVEMPASDFDGTQGIVATSGPTLRISATPNLQDVTENGEVFIRAMNANTVLWQFTKNGEDSLVPLASESTGSGVQGSLVDDDSVGTGGGVSGLLRLTNEGDEAGVGDQVIATSESDGAFQPEVCQTAADEFMERMLADDVNWKKVCNPRRRAIRALHCRNRVLRRQAKAAGEGKDIRQKALCPLRHEAFKKICEQKLLTNKDLQGTMNPERRTKMQKKFRERMRKVREKIRERRDRLAGRRERQRDRRERERGERGPRNPRPSTRDGGSQPQPGGPENPPPQPSTPGTTTGLLGMAETTHFSNRETNEGDDAIFEQILDEFRTRFIERCTKFKRPRFVERVQARQSQDSNTQTPVE